MNKDLPSDTQLEKTPGHQGDNSTGGKLERLRVLYCTNVPFAMNFEMVALMAKQFGRVERVRLKIADDETSLDTYIIYECHKSAEKAHVALNGHSMNDKPLQTSLFDISNLKEDPFDYYPEQIAPVIERKAPTPIWFVANYKTGLENYIKASDTLNKALNGIPPNNMKRYGKNILIKAKNKIQSKLLQAYLPSPESNISHVSPHNSFNFSKGIIYSKDLYELTEDEILKRSPSNIYLVKKLKGTNNVILLHFTTEFLPDFVNFGDHIRIKVRRFKPSPKQCRNCLEYGHVKDYCLKNQRCHRCSSHHEPEYVCRNEPFCFWGEGKHSPISNECPRRKLEKEIVETADVERISIGSAKRQVMGANRNENSNYAKAISIMKSAKKHEAVGKTNGVIDQVQRETRLSVPTRTKDMSGNVGENSKNKPQSLQSSKSLEHSKSDPSISRASSTSETSKSGAKSKDNKRNKATRANEEGWWIVPGTKRPLQLSPTKSEIETQNRFEALDPFGPLHLSQPMKKIALSSSCMNLSSREETELPVTTPMEEPPPATAEGNRNLQSDISDNNKDNQKSPPEHERSSRTPPESHRKSFKDRPTKLNRPSGSAKNLASLAKLGKTGSTNPKPK